MISRMSMSGKLVKLREYTGYLKLYQKYSVQEIKKDPTLQGAVLHYLQVSIECMMDISEMIISEQGFRKPIEAREIFPILAENRVVPKVFSERLSKMAGFRNILVHEYVDVDLARVHSHLRNDLKDFDLFARSVAKFLKSH